MTAPAAGQDRTTVAVGYDGAEAAKGAVRWAAEDTAAGNSRLRVVHAWVWPLFTKQLGPVAGVKGSGLRQSAESILADGAEPARAARADARVTGAHRAATAAAPEGPTPEIAADPGPDVEGLVVGSRGIGGVPGHVAGSACLELAASSPCPLMVIRRPRSPGERVAPVVVRVDGTSRRSEAPAGAAEPAAVLGTSLRIVHIDQSRGGAGEGHGRHIPLRRQELLDRAREEARSHIPQRLISVDLREGRAL